MQRGRNLHLSLCCDSREDLHIITTATILMNTPAWNVWRARLYPANGEESFKGPWTPILQLENNHLRPSTFYRSQSNANFTSRQGHGAMLDYRARDLATIHCRYFISRVSGAMIVPVHRVVMLVRVSLENMEFE